MDGGLQNVLYHTPWRVLTELLTSGSVGRKKVTVVVIEGGASRVNSASGVISLGGFSALNSVFATAHYRRRKRSVPWNPLFILFTVGVSLHLQQIVTNYGFPVLVRHTGTPVLCAGDLRNHLISDITAQFFLVRPKMPIPMVGACPCQWWMMWKQLRSVRNPHRLQISRQFEHNAGVVY